MQRRHVDYDRASIPFAIFSIVIVQMSINLYGYEQDWLYLAIVFSLATISLIGQTYLILRLCCRLHAQGTSRAIRMKILRRYTIIYLCFLASFVINFFSSLVINNEV